jgi:hypothetical protein
MSRAHKLAMLLIGLSGERAVIRFVVAAVCHSTSTTAPQGGTCTPTALRAERRESGCRTAGAFTPSTAQRRQISVR